MPSARLRVCDAQPIRGGTTLRGILVGIEDRTPFHLTFLCKSVGKAASDRDRTALKRANERTGIRTMMLQCDNCGRRHRTWRNVSRCKFPNAYFVGGEGPIACISKCKAWTISLWPSVEEAKTAKRIIDRLACGCRCQGEDGHFLYHLGCVAEWEDRPRRPRKPGQVDYEKRWGPETTRQLDRRLYWWLVNGR